MTKSKIKEQIKYWKEVFVPTGNMGKWWAQTQVDKWTKKLNKKSRGTSKCTDGIHPTRPHR